MPTSVKFFSSAHPNAPVLTGAAGTLLAVLDACLVNGYGLVSASGLTVAGGIATMTFPLGHSFEPNAVALIAGATPSQLNGEKRVLTTTANSITFDATSIGDQVAIGSITAKVAPLGWAQLFTGTNKAAYKSADPASTGCVLRVDDSPSGYAVARGYETMSDIDTGTGPFPTLADSDLLWPKNAGYYPANAAPWFVVGDGLMFYLWVADFPISADFKNGFVWAFGDVIKANSSDAFACLINGFNATSDVTQSNETVHQIGFVNGPRGTSARKYWPRSYTGIGSAVRASDAMPGTDWTGAVGYTSGLEPYPNPIDNAIGMTTLHVHEGANGGRRGQYPGLYIPTQYLTAVSPFFTGDNLTNVAGLPGRAIKAVRRGPPGMTNSASAIFFDVTGPWR